MTMGQRDPAEVYRRIGVRPIIHGAGSTTRLGGSRTRSEVLQAMADAAVVPVDVDDLNQKAGEAIARITGAEAGFVSSGAAGGLVLQAAACIAGKDPVKMKQLPDTDAMKNEIIIQNMHRFPYEQAYRAAGARLVQVGDSRQVHPWELEGAINDRTAAVAYLVAPFTNRRALSLEQVCEIAHARGVPVIVDAASTLPPREHLRTFIRSGADMVALSGGKGVRGPQGSGILCGTKDLIEAAAANASPAQFLGRPMKVAKEEIIGLLTALEIFVKENEEEENRRYNALCQRVVDALTEGPGLDVSVAFDGIDYLIPNAVIRFGRDWRGPSSGKVADALQRGYPAVHLSQLGGPGELAVDPLNLLEDEMDILVSRMREELFGS